MIFESYLGPRVYALLRNYVPMHLGFFSQMFHIPPPNIILKLLQNIHNFVVRKDKHFLDFFLFQVPDKMPTQKWQHNIINAKPCGHGDTDVVGTYVSSYSTYLL